MTVADEAASPRKESLERIDQVAATIAPDDVAHTRWFDEYARQHAVRLAFDLEVVQAHAGPGRRILEYGAIPLLLTAALKALGHDVTALDVAPDRFSRSIAELDLTVKRCDFEVEPVPFSDGEFDLVVFNELFEHLRINPVFTMREVHRVLRPGGLLLLSTPNLRSLDGLRNILLHNRSVASGIYDEYEKLEKLGHMGHVREYTSREIVEFLARVGFVPEKLVWRGRNRSRIARVVTDVATSLRPFITVIASKA